MHRIWLFSHLITGSFLDFFLDYSISCLTVEKKSNKIVFLILIKDFCLLFDKLHEADLIVLFLSLVLL